MIHILQKVISSQIISRLFVMALLLLTLQVTPVLWSQQLVWLEYLVVGGCLVMAISSLFLKTNCQLTVVDILVTVWWWYVFLCAYLKTGYPCSYEMTVYSVLYGLYVLLRFLFSVFPLRDGILEHLFMFAAFLEVGLGIWQLGVGKSLHPLFPVTGSFYNPGPYAAYVAIGMSIALVQLAELRKEARYYYYRKVAYLLLLVFGTFVLLIAGSRGALLSLFVVAFWKYGRLIRRYLGYLIVVGFSLGTVLLYAKFGSVMGRLVIWYLSGKMIAENCLLGAGIGSFKGEYGQALFHFFSQSSQADYFAHYVDVTDYAFCDLLQVGVEQGLIGILLCLTLIVLAIHIMSRNTHGLFAALLALLVFSLFSYPFQLLPFQILGVVLLAKIPMVPVRCLCLTWRKHLCLSLVVVMVGWQGIGFARTHVKARLASLDATLSIYAAYINDCYPLLEYCSEDKAFLFNFAKMLQADGRYVDSNFVLMQGTKVSNDPMFWVLMGNNLKAMRLYDEAVACYDRASGMLPNRVYPIYQKMKLYLETGRICQAKRCAHHLLARKPKVQSSATKQMYDEACAVLKH